MSQKTQSSNNTNTKGGKGSTGGNANASPVTPSKQEKLKYQDTKPAHEEVQRMIDEISEFQRKLNTTSNVEYAIEHLYNAKQQIPVIMSAVSNDNPRMSMDDVERLIGEDLTQDIDDPLNTVIVNMSKAMDEQKRYGECEIHARNYQSLNNIQIRLRSIKDILLGIKKGKIRFEE